MAREMPPQEKFENSVHLNNNRESNVATCQNSSNAQTGETDSGVKEETRDMDFDELLPYVGEFGLYQKILFILMIPFASFVAWVYFSQIFITLIPDDYWCWVPELENLTVNERLSLAIPANHEGYSRCSMYDVNYREILLNESHMPDPLWPTKACQHGWEFNYSTVPYATVATELGWVCQYDALPTIAQSIFFVGAIFGGLIFGWIADQYGRIPALIGANLMGFLAGVATAFTDTFWQFTLCRFFVGFAFDNCFTMMYILVLEYVGPKWRTFVANMSIAMFFTFAACILPWIAYFLADWRMTCIATSVPLVVAVMTPWLIPESARWLVSQGQVDRAIEILGKFERINGTKVPDDIYKRFRDTCARICKEEEADKTYSVMAISLVFDGHVRNVDNLGLNVFVTFTIAAATELPADTFLTLVLDRWGRRWLACGSLVVSGVFSIWASAVSNPSLAILGRFWINISYNIGLQYAAEVLPTVVRAQGVALIHIMGYVASILAPYVVYLDVVSSILPLLVLGTLGIIGGILTLFLPETLDKDLPQTLQDGEDFGRDQKMWDFPCIGRKDEEEEIPPRFRSLSTCSARNSMRASLRGETLRSTMLRRSSIKSRKSGNSVIEVERL
ncbi:hypothetical protein E2986_10608 [Frieseomelitta varia]|uniref:Major facilitator superfamily (MFS) profile domain-containing protein n=1 Tax=Frieseomelitta varia TaxID=561572 RepID=A0A833W7Q9_9HYME|nr:hypothetical protein E2986_10608 [Frieseomelitta varia]